MVGGGGGGEGGESNFPGPDSLLGTRGLRSWSSSTQVSYSTGPPSSVQLGPSQCRVVEAPQRKQKHQRQQVKPKIQDELDTVAVISTKEMALSLSGYLERELHGIICKT